MKRLIKLSPVKIRRHSDTGDNFHGVNRLRNDYGSYNSSTNDN